RDPSTKRPVCWPEGGTVIIHPALAATTAAALTCWLKVLHVRLLEHGTFGHQAGREIAPQRHHQLARQGDDGHAPDPAAGVEGALPEPMCERAVRLMPQPQPRELDRLLPGAWIARFADPLFAIGASASPWTGSQPEIAGDLPPVV